MVNVTKKQLEALVTDLQKELEALRLAHSQVEQELEAAHGAARGHAEALAAAQAETAAAEQAAIEAQARVTAAEHAAAAAAAEAAAVEASRAALEQQLAQAATTGGAAAAGTGEHLPDIPRPAGSGWPIRESMEMNHADYAEIQRTVRSLVIRAQLDWTDDFRRQDADKLATLFRAARKLHPVLRRYVNNWATAAIAKQYMQNKRKHAYKQGYIKKKPNGMDEGNRRRHDEDDSMGGAASSAGGISA
ncbi:hypothetical protein C2E23DRAFT_887938 [Lenzites betulinus]|nr:hypothetical protein C2E23DRAFT_887938 [Lenzites betulinus]